jgi:hypothetical protein
MMSSWRTNNLAGSDEMSEMAPDCDEGWRGDSVRERIAAGLREMLSYESEATSMSFKRET